MVESDIKCRRAGSTSCLVRHRIGELIRVNGTEGQNHSDEGGCKFALNRIQGKYMLENKKLSDREIMYQFLRRIPIQNRTIAYDIVNRDLNEK